MVARHSPTALGLTQVQAASGGMAPLGDTFSARGMALLALVPRDSKHGGTCPHGAV